MTFAELVLAVAGVAAIYLLLSPVQRRLERYLLRKLAGRPRGHLPTIDVTDFSVHRAHRKEHDTHDNDS